MQLLYPSSLSTVIDLLQPTIKKKLQKERCKDRRQNSVNRIEKDRPKQRSVKNTFKLVA